MENRNASPSVPDDVVMDTSLPTAAPMPSAHHAQFAHQPPASALTQNGVGIIANGCRLQI